MRGVSPGDSLAAARLCADEAYYDGNSAWLVNSIYKRGAKRDATDEEMLRQIFLRQRLDASLAAPGEWLCDDEEYAARALLVLASAWEADAEQWSWRAEIRDMYSCVAGELRRAKHYVARRRVYIAVWISHLRTEVLLMGVSGLMLACV